MHTRPKEVREPDRNTTRSIREFCPNGTTTVPIWDSGNDFKSRMQRKFVNEKSNSRRRKNSKRLDWKRLGAKPSSSAKGKNKVTKKISDANGTRPRLRRSASSNKLIAEFVTKDKVTATTKKIPLEKNG